MIEVTEIAVKQLQELLEEKQLDAQTHGLRLGVEKGGCAGMQYIMQITEPQDQDIVVENQGVRILIDPDSKEFLENCQVDYEVSLSDSGFRIRNPQASRTCGCGTSFETQQAVSTS